MSRFKHILLVGAPALTMVALQSLEGGQRIPIEEPPPTISPEEIFIDGSSRFQPAGKLNRAARRALKRNQPR